MDNPRPPIQPNSTKPSSFYPAHEAGVLYQPGQWPTPELLMHPVERYKLCDSGPLTSETLQKMLDDMDPSSIIYLPQSSKWAINHTINLHEHQELATWGYPVEEKQMASLEAGKDCYPNIVNARAITGAKLRNVIVDGGREKYGHEPQCEAMLLCVSQKFSIHYEYLYESLNANLDIMQLTRSLIDAFSAILGVAFQGSHNVRITNNRIGPAGVVSDKEGNTWADGISFAGSDGLVAGNEITNATDGAIVLFCAPGTLVISNTIIMQDGVKDGRKSVALGGINMVDSAGNDYKGNYSGTRVFHNTLITRGSGYFKTGIGQGPNVWWLDRPEQVNYGAVVKYNLIDSQAINGQFGSFGYGFPIASNVRDWICFGNVSLDHVPYTGDLTKSLPTPNASPGPFIYDSNPLETVFISSIAEADANQGKVVLQSEFKGHSGRVASLISIEPGVTRILTYRPGQFSLHSGQSIQADIITLSFDEGNYIRIRQGGPDILWEHESRHPEIPEQYLHYSEAGKLLIDSPQGPVVDDLTPYIHSNIEGGSFTISSLNPYLTITKPDPNPYYLINKKAPPLLHSLLFASAYIFPVKTSFLLGQIVARSYMDRTIIYTTSPYGQFVVLRSKRPNAPLPTLPLAWPEKEREPEWDWEIVWHTPEPEPPTDRGINVSMSFQGDGNLVIYSNGKGLWKSGTRKPPVSFLRLGLGFESDSEPWLELLNDKEERVWSSN